MRGQQDSLASSRLSCYISYWLLNCKLVVQMQVVFYYFFIPFTKVTINKIYFFKFDVQFFANVCFLGLVFISICKWRNGATGRSSHMPCVYSVKQSTLSQTTEETFKSGIACWEERCWHLDKTVTVAWVTK